MTSRDRSPDPPRDAPPAGDTGTAQALVQEALLGDPGALGTLLQKHKERLRRIVTIRLAARLGRVLDQEALAEEVLRPSLLAGREGTVATEADLVPWMARMIERELRRRGDGSAAEAGERPRSLHLEGDEEARRAQRAGSERLVDALVVELEPDALREVLLLRDYCAADWELVRARLDLLSVDAAQALYRRAHEQLARRMRAHLRRDA